MFEIYVIRGMLKIILSFLRGDFLRWKSSKYFIAAWIVLTRHGLFRALVSLVVLGIIDTKFYGFKGPRLYTAREGKIAKEDPRFEPSHDPSAISEDASVEDAAILPRAWERSSPTVKFCRSGIRASGFRRKKL